MLSFPSGNEIYGPWDVGLDTTMSLSNLDLQPGFLYFATVHAYNPLGLVTSFTSDGVTVDTEEPMAGVVYTSLTFQDEQSHGNMIEASWVGFNDLHSYIERYEWAIGIDIMHAHLEFQSSMLETSMSRSATNLAEGKEYFVYVRAVDAAGHVSQIAKSNAIVFDRTPPEGIICHEYLEMEGAWEFTCHSSDDSQFTDTYIVCKLNNPLLAEEGRLYQITLASNHFPENFQGRIQLDDHWDWVHFVRESHNSFSHSSHILPRATHDITPTLYVFKGELDAIDVGVAECQNASISTKPIRMKQTGPVTISLQWNAQDTISAIHSQQVGFGTTSGGFQLLPLTDVGLVSSMTIPLQLSHQMQVYAVLLIENQAGIRSTFLSYPLLIDWTPPELSELDVQLSLADDGTISIDTAWNVWDSETEVHDCHWQIG